MTAAGAERRATRVSVAPDVPRFDVAGIGPQEREALAELLLSLADDEFVVGFRDSEWTGIAPMLEEDVAFSSISQDELGHARVFLELLAQLTGRDPDAIAFDRPPEGYRHAALLDHPRGDWAGTIVRRWLYDTADAARLAALAETSFVPLREVVRKIRREERYHLAHLDAWIARLARGDESRRRLEAALAVLWSDASSVFAPLEHEQRLLDAGVLGEPMRVIAERHWAALGARLSMLGVEPPGPAVPPAAPRLRTVAAPAFVELWDLFTSVRRSDPEASW